MKLKNLWKGIKIGVAVGKTIATGTVAKSLKDVGIYVDLTERTVAQIKQAAEDVKKK